MRLSAIRKLARELSDNGRLDLAIPPTLQSTVKKHAAALHDAVLYKSHIAGINFASVARLGFAASIERVSN